MFLNHYLSLSLSLSLGERVGVRGGGSEGFPPHTGPLPEGEGEEEIILFYLR